jgi:tetratricopeptide (TPR) repeat protein
VTSSSAIGVTGGVLDARKVVQIFPFAVLVICSAFVFFYKNIKSQYSKIIWKYGLLILLSLFFMQQSVVLIDYTNHLRSDTDFYENWNSIKEFNINNNINLEDVIIIDKLHVAPFIFYKRVDFKTNRAKIIYYTLTNGKITYNDIISPLFNNVLNNNTGNLYMLIYGNRPELMPSHSFRDIIVGGVFNNSNFIIYKIEKSNNLSNLSTYHDSITTYIQLLLIIKDARNLELRGKPANSLELYNKSLELDPNNKNLWIAKGRVLGQLSHYNGSIEAYNEAIELDPNDNNIRDAKLRS